MSVPERPATAWVWLNPQVVQAVHGEQLQAHGGPAGLRDLGALEAALMRPLQLWTDQEHPQPDVAALFGSLARGTARPGSDVDVLVDFGGPASPEAYFSVQFYLEDLLGQPVDLVTERALRPRLSPYVAHDAIDIG